MKFAALWIAVIFASGYEAAIPYFSRTRTLTSSADRQNYFVVDSDIWKFARPDLADVRLYEENSQVPYALIKQSGGSSSEESPARIVNLGKTGDHTEFDLDVRGLNEYGRVRLQLEAKNFINNARVQGRRDLNDRTGTDLGSSTLYDFTNEGLGSNFVLKFSQSSFPYLHVRMASGVSPGQIKGAYVSNFSEIKTLWTQAGTCAAAASLAKQSTFACSIFEGMPVERVAFDLPASAVNFNRTVIVIGENGNEFAEGSISRVRLNRAGQSVVSETLAIDLHSYPARQLKVIIENGDDRPLPIQQVRPLAIERRVYFDPRGNSTLALYYGDEKLGSPSYDYQKFFQQNPDSVIAQLGPAMANPQFTGRPDERPWSERHQWVLWIAMLIAVALLGALALRGLKSSRSS